MSLVFKLFGSYLGSYWREAVALVALALAVSYCHGRDNAIRAAQKAKDDAVVLAAKLRVHDSIDTALRDSIATVSAKVDTATKVVLRWRVDTLQAWRHDTITVDGVPSFPVPVSTQAQTDAAQAACHDLAINCQAFKRFAIQKFHTDSVAIGELRAARPLTITTSCRESNVVSGLLGATVGGVLGFGVAHVSR